MPKNSSFLGGGGTILVFFWGGGGSADFIFTARPATWGLTKIFHCESGPVVHAARKMRSDLI